MRYSVRLQLYPNPASGLFNVIITLPSVTNVVASVSVINASGNVVLQTKIIHAYQLPDEIKKIASLTKKLKRSGQGKREPFKGFLTVVKYNDGAGLCIRCYIPQAFLRR